MNEGRVFYLLNYERASENKFAIFNFILLLDPAFITFIVHI